MSVPPSLPFPSHFIPVPERDGDRREPRECKEMGTGPLGFHSSLPHSVRRSEGPRAVGEEKGPKGRRYDGY